MIITVPMTVHQSRQSGVSMPLPAYAGIRMPLQDFLLWEADDGYQYEWEDGLLEAQEGMRPEERIIHKRLIDRFSGTELFRQGYRLFSEARCSLDSIKRIRIPDLALFSPEQIDHPRSAPEGPLWILELISPSNSSIEIEAKMREFFQTGTRMVWHLYPALNEVRIYDSPTRVRILVDSDVCDGGPVVNDFQIIVDDIFLEK